MNDYRLVQLAELDQKIEDARFLLSDPSMTELVEQEIQDEWQQHAKRQAAPEELQQHIAKADGNHHIQQQPYRSEY